MAFTSSAELAADRPWPCRDVSQSGRTRRPSSIDEATDDRSSRDSKVASLLRGSTLNKKLLRLTLVSEGSSDRALLPIVLWAIGQRLEVDTRPEWADLRKLRAPPRNLVDKVRTATELYPCDILFVHRDSDQVGLEARVNEIQHAAVDAGCPALVCVVPVRATEAWLLFSEKAIRLAAGRPRGTHEVEIPSLSRIEAISDPKAVLHDLLREASGLQGRRRRQLRVEAAVYRVAELVDSFEPLRRLSAFRAFEDQLDLALSLWSRRAEAS